MTRYLATSVTLVLCLSFVGCATSKEESPLQDSGRPSASTAPESALERSGQDLRQSAKFARLSKTIRFESGGATLSPDTKRALDEIANEMNVSANSFQRVRISGFSDAMGNPTRNQEMSLQRAEAVRSYLISRGVDSAKLEAVGMGSLYANQNKKLSKAQINEDRRVELEIVE
jgi:outer membrane protein OmpA-like peptidoglycan-associated protein